MPALPDQTAWPASLILALPVSQLSARGARDLRFVPDGEGRAALARHLDLLDLPRLRFEGRIVPEGRGDWRLEGRLAARVVQPCVVTLAPVATRIETDLLRRYLADWTEPDETETEMPADDSAEPLGGRIDVAAAVIEALDLALPAWPRAAGASLPGVAATPPGSGGDRPDEPPARPLAALAALRDRLVSAADTGSEGGRDTPAATPAAGAATSRKTAGRSASAQDGSTSGQPDQRPDRED